MKKATLSFILIVFSLSILFAESSKVNFFKGSYSSAKQQAAIEGKLYFVDFMASWCMPCQWMEKTTYSDERLANYIHQNYIPIKVDIDDFDGFALKQQYNIKLLPSILVFNSQGKLLARYEESLSASKMLGILRRFNTQQNRKKTKSTYHPTKPVSYTPPPAPKATKRIKPASVSSPSHISRPALGKTKVKPYTPPTNRPSTPVASGDGLFRFSVERQASKGYSVQIGVFGEYGNVLREVARLEEMYDVPIIVHISKLNQKTVYKVLLGAFAKQQDAIVYKNKLKAKNVIGIIKDLSTMK